MWLTYNSQTNAKYKTNIFVLNKSLAEFSKSILTSAYNYDNEVCMNDSVIFSLFKNALSNPANYISVSYDVVSVFTNLTLDVILISIERH